MPMDANYVSSNLLNEILIRKLTDMESKLLRLGF